MYLFSASANVTNVSMWWDRRSLPLPKAGLFTRAGFGRGDLCFTTAAKDWVWREKC